MSLEGDSENYPDPEGIFPHPEINYLTERIAEVRDVFEVIRYYVSASSGRSVPWIKFHLNPRQLIYLSRRLQLDRNNWQALHQARCHFWMYNTFIVKIRSSIHETLVSRLFEEFLYEFAALARRYDNSTEEVLGEGIKAHRSFPVILDDNDGYLQPDLAFVAGNSQYPLIVIEITTSETIDMLEEVAKLYVHGTGGAVPFIFGITYPWQNTKRATISAWTPLFREVDGDMRLECSRVMHEEDFRDEQGMHTPDHRGEILFRIPNVRTRMDAADGANGHYTNATVHLTAERLHKVVLAAEYMSEVVGQGRPSHNDLPVAEVLAMVSYITRHRARVDHRFG